MKAMNLDLPRSTGNDLQLYQIRNKDQALGTFTLEAGKFARMQDGAKLPNFIRDNFEEWLKNRFVSHQRANMRQVYEDLHITCLGDVIKQSLGISLNDTLWITTEDDTTAWREISPYTIEPSEYISLMAFTGRSCGIKTFYRSPEFTTHGNLAKCWIHNAYDGKFHLYKTLGSPNLYGDVGYLYSLLGSKLARFLGVAMPKQQLSTCLGQRVITSELWTNEDHSAFHALDFFKGSPLSQDIATMSEEHQQEVSNILLLNYLFGTLPKDFMVICNADTFEVESFAHLSGYSSTRFIFRLNDYAPYVNTLRLSTYVFDGLEALLNQRDFYTDDFEVKDIETTYKMILRRLLALRQELEE